MTARAREMVEAALQYAEHGVPIFQCWHADGARCGCRALDCASPAKHPIASTAPAGFKNATTDLAIIRHTFELFPHANIAEATGHYSTVLDVDPAKGGRETLARLVAQHGPLPETPKVLTGGGGEHYRFQPVPGLRCSTGRLGPGLDVRGVDGYALLPPSNHVSGGLYLDDLMAPMFETPLAPMPAWLVALAVAPTNGRRDGSAPVTADEWAERLQGAPEGRRRAVALQIAGHYLGLGIAPAEVETILLGYAARCVPPFSEREARELVRDLARRDRAKGRGPAETPTTAVGLDLVSVGELLGEPDSGPAWAVEKRLPAAGLGLLAGKPKAGKSTLARCLALRVARGEPWLGCPTVQGAVIYLALEEKREEIREHFRALGATSADPIYVLCASAPDDALARLRLEVEQRRPVLIIIDPLFRFVRVPAERGNDYATMTAVLEPLLQLARETGAHVLALHHLGKGERGDGDAILGSTAIFAAVDTALLLKRSERYRTLSSIQRYGEDLEEITLTLDPVTRDVAAGLPRKEAEGAEAARLILAFLDHTTEPVTEPMLVAEIEARTQAQRAALRALVRDGKVTRNGRGTKGDPFRYVTHREQESTERPQEAML